jgi:hypothetical protein
MALRVVMTKQSPCYEIQSFNNRILFFNGEYGSSIELLHGWGLLRPSRLPALHSQ